MIDQTGGQPGTFWSLFIFSQKQCLRPLGYCTPQFTSGINFAHFLGLRISKDTSDEKLTVNLIILFDD